MSISRCAASWISSRKKSASSLLAITPGRSIMVSVIVLSFVVVGRWATSDYEEVRWPPDWPRAALRQKAPRAASYTTRWGTTIGLSRDGAKREFPKFKDY